MVNINKTFYDKTCDIGRVSVVDKRGTQVPQETIIYEKLPCDYYIAPRGNVINYLPNAEARNTERDRFDCVIPGPSYNMDNPIKKGDTVTLYDSASTLEGSYIIDQMTIYRLPNGKIENIYLRLNNDSKGDLH